MNISASTYTYNSELNETTVHSLCESSKDTVETQLLIYLSTYLSISDKLWADITLFWLLDVLLRDRPQGWFKKAQFSALLALFFFPVGGFFLFES